MPLVMVKYACQQLFRSDSHQDCVMCTLYSVQCTVHSHESYFHWVQMAHYSMSEVRPSLTLDITSKFTSLESCGYQTKTSEMVCLGLLSSCAPSTHVDRNRPQLRPHA